MEAVALDLCSVTGKFDAKKLVVVCGLEQPRFEYRPNGVSGAFDLHERILLGEGHEVYGVFPFYPDADPRKNDRFVPSVMVPGTGGWRMAWPKMCTPFDQVDLLTWVSQLNPDLIWIHGPYQIAVKLAAIAKMLGIPYVLHMHTDLTGYIEARCPETLWGPAKWIKLRQACALANGAALVVFPSRTYHEKFIRETGWRGKSIVFPTVVPVVDRMSDDDRADFSDQFRSNHLPLDSSAYPMCTYAGRLDREKNVEFLPAVHRHLLDLIREIPIEGIVAPVMAIVGGGSPSYKLYLKGEFEKLGLSSLVYFAGPKPSSREVRQVLGVSEQLWYPVLTGTQEFVLFEAAQEGCIALGAKGTVSEEFFPGRRTNLFMDPHTWAVHSYQLLRWQKNREQVAKRQYDDAMRYADEGLYKEQLLQICHKVAGKN